jgi:hypothetical protein
VILSRLDSEIDQKCLEIRRRRRDHALRAAFVVACCLFLLLPGLLVFLGVSLWSFFIPFVLFFSVGFCLLSPLIFSRKPGGSENESL